MSNFKKHVGRIKNTDRRCVVVYNQIPGNEENALVVDTDALPDRFHDALIQVIDSVEGQQTQDMSSLLARRVMPDLGLSILNALHSYGFLRPVPIDNIVMYPAPNAPCPLRTIVDVMNGTQTKEVKDEPHLENRILENQKSQADESQHSVAVNILRQAEDLEAEAARKREQAYRMYPALRPHDHAPVETPVNVNEVVETVSTTPDTVVHEGPVEEPFAPSVDFVMDPDLPADVLAALKASMEQGFIEDPVESETANQVDTSDEAIQEFLDRVALREDKADKEKWEAMQPKNPVGRPRKDGLPVGSKPPKPAPKKRGRPPKAPS